MLQWQRHSNRGQNVGASVAQFCSTFVFSFWQQLLFQKNRSNVGNKRNGWFDLLKLKRIFCWYSPLLIIAVKMFIAFVKKEPNNLYSLHGGPDSVLSLIWLNFWIPHDKSTVKNELRLRFTCKHLVAKSIKQITGDLPATRIISCRPFQYVGID